MSAVEDENLKEESVLLIFLMVVVMSLFSIGLLVVMVKRSLKIAKFKIYRVFLYISFYIVTKLLTCALLIINILYGLKDGWKKLTAQSIEVKLKDSIIFAEISMVLMFIVTFEFYYVICLGSVPHLMKALPKFQQISKGIQVFFFISSIILLILFSVEVVSYNVMNIIEIAVNSLLILWFIGTFFYLTFQMTGIMLSKKRQEQMGKAYKLLILLLLSRFITCTAEFFIHFGIKDGSFIGLIELIKSKEDYFLLQACIFIGYIVYIFITEGVPLIYCIKEDTMKVFLREEKEGLLSNEIEEISIESSDFIPSKSIEHISSPFLVDLNSFEELEPLAMQSEIWAYYKGKYQQNYFFVRKANEQISKYLMEDVIKEIIEFREKNIRELNPMGYFEEQGYFFIFEPFREINLDMFMEKISDAEKHKKVLEIMLAIAQSVSILHENGVVHGCLSPSNIFVLTDENTLQKRIVFSGYGLQSMKRYLSMTADYTNKTAYSAVEHLSNRNGVIINPKKESDSYSFGMMLYEFLSGNKSHRDLSLRELEKMICEENSRPKIDESIHQLEKDLIRKCWAQQPFERPSMPEIVFELKRIIKEIL